MEPGDNLKTKATIPRHQLRAPDEYSDRDSRGYPIVWPPVSSIRKSLLLASDEEQERNKLQYCKFLLMYDGRLHLAPMSENPQNILDQGTGNGIWAIDVADRYPSSRIIVVNIAAVQRNCPFEIVDVESD
ncbi:uncharacterized protein Z518_00561 [Rhinocladiella mackenziei CBS 650.93]|uniref:Rhinocladiella mackenziei CBS 650.93 unplaced genomic scaffold supercont1.1, whole genome shotgun sequence n=1 Tax=Rhinocladiella mackenziei CBS 650.93 TaxID=1442369 RepID=A0A0D2J1C6_9EURO|nr:uncharacterized protein Z518_00561 [Rhinocladiella mackenziei CBS 650.93]KIX09481.1 hypothetical protein Z518_00561 [Rhinocladiella mackenziei CBS 650.93]